MKKLVLAAVAATMSAGISSAGDLEVPNTCIVGHGVSTLHDGREVVDLDSVNEMIACVISEQLSQTAILESKLAAAEGYADTYQSAMESARSDLIAMTENRDNWRGVAENNLDRIAELKAELSNVETELSDAETELGHTRKNTQHMFDILQVITDHKANAGRNFARDPVGYITFAFQYIEDRQADLRRAEDRIRELESNRNKNPLNANNW